jgi:glycosyltransferase involved in cell wall biosynthesis
MNVTVVICAYTLERWDLLTEAVASCADQTLVPDEVVVVVDHNEELFQRATASFPSARVLRNRSTKGLSGARNTGVAATSGEAIAFLDDDACADPDWLAQLCEPLKDEDVAGVGGWIVPEWHGAPAAWFPETYYWILGCSYAGLPETGDTLRNPIGANMVLRRTVFDAVGGFTSGIGRIGKVPLGCEETELCIRYTSRRPDERFVLTHDAVVHHVVPPSRLSLRYFVSRCWAEGLSKAAVASLVGTKDGLSSERRHLLRAMPRELGSSLQRLPRQPFAATTKIVLIVVGGVLAAAGLARGRLAVRRKPLVPGQDELALLLDEA